MDHIYALVNHVICKLEASDRTMELSNFVHSSLCSVVLGGSLNQRTFLSLATFILQEKHLYSL